MSKSAYYIPVQDPRYAGPNTTITYSSSYSCTFCGFTGNLEEITNHKCFIENDVSTSKTEDPDDIPLRRFDPFESLDVVRERVEAIEDAENSEVDMSWCIGLLADIRGEIHAIRAYITGIER